MRVNQFSNFRNIQNALEQIQSRKYFNEVRLATGKQIVDLSDSPNELFLVKKYENFISTKKQYQNNLDFANNFIQQTVDSIESISNHLQKIHQIAIEATKIGVSNEVSILGKNVLGLIKDIIKDLNSDFAGKYVFAGTKFTPDALNHPPGSTNILPFELIEVIPTTNNPSGLQLLFKGNNKKISINSEKGSTEIINSTVDELFGDSSATSFNDLIELYNLLTYNEDGTPRTNENLFNNHDIAKLDIIQKKIAEMIDRVNRIASKNGSILNRIEVQRGQLENLITMYDGLKSKISDADFARVTIELTKDQTALQYVLQVGSKLFQSTLFDFLR